MESWENLSCAAIGISSLLRTSVPWSFILHEQGSWFFAHWCWHSVDSAVRRCECAEEYMLPH